MRVLVQPGDFLLAVRRDEAAVDELVLFEIELARRGCVFAADGEIEDAVFIAGIEAVVAMKDPAGVFLLAERVDIEDGLPVRIRSRVIVHGGFAEESADVLLVVPEVVDLVAAEIGERKAVGVFDDLESVFVVGWRSADRLP